MKSMESGDDSMDKVHGRWKERVVLSSRTLKWLLLSLLLISPGWVWSCETRGQR